MSKKKLLSSGLEPLAAEIENLGRSIHQLLNGRLTKRAIALLIQDRTTPKVGIGTINVILDSAADLHNVYLKKAQALKPEGKQ